MGISVAKGKMCITQVSRHVCVYSSPPCFSISLFNEPFQRILEKNWSMKQEEDQAQTTDKVETRQGKDHSSRHHTPRKWKTMPTLLTDCNQHLAPKFSPAGKQIKHHTDKFKKHLPLLRVWGIASPFLTLNQFQWATTYQLTQDPSPSVTFIPLENIWWAKMPPQPTEPIISKVTLRHGA